MRRLSGVIFSPETSEVELSQRFIASSSCARGEALRKERVTTSESPKVVDPLEPPVGDADVRRRVERDWGHRDLHQFAAPAPGPSGPLSLIISTSGS
jgi:hypothetical protein